EYCHMITTSFLMVILFFGGWHIPYIVGGDAHWFLKLAAFAFKVSVMILFYMAVRWTIPRFRFDQLMGLAWKVLIPLALVNLVAVMVVLEFGWSKWYLLPASLVILIATAALATSGEVRAPKRVIVNRAG